MVRRHKKLDKVELAQWPPPRRRAPAAAARGSQPKLACDALKRRALNERRHDDDEEDDVEYRFAVPDIGFEHERRDEAGHSGTSQHLAALRRQGLVETRRQGTTIYYRLKDPRVTQLLNVARQILTSNLAETRELLANLDTPPVTTKQRKT